MPCTCGLMTEALISSLRGLPVFLPDGRRLGQVHDAIVEVDHWSASHLFVIDCVQHLVEDGIHVAIPWHWVRAVSEVVLLRWFPPTPIPASPMNH